MAASVSASLGDKIGQREWPSPGMKAARGLAASVRVAQDASVCACVFVCAELPLVAMGTGLALGLQISLVPDYSPR